MALSDGAIAGIVVGSILGFILLLVLFFFLLRKWWQGPTKGSDNPKRLDGRVGGCTFLRTWL